MFKDLLGTDTGMSCECPGWAAALLSAVMQLRKMKWFPESLGRDSLYQWSRRETVWDIWLSVSGRKSKNRGRKNFKMQGSDDVMICSCKGLV